MDKKIKEQLLTYLHENFAVVLIAQGKKHPLSTESWRPENYNKCLLEKWLNHKGNFGILTGAPNDNLEVLDFDVKNYPHGERKELVEEFYQLVKENDGGEQLFRKLMFSSTPSGGCHFFYRCETIEGNQKLAKNKEDLAFIETRGSKGLVVCEPSEGYEVRYGSWKKIPTITPEERNLLISCCRALNEYFDDKNHGHEINNQITLDRDNPFNAANLDAEGYLNKLFEDGWQEKYRRGDDVHLVRPGKDLRDGASAIFSPVPEKGIYPFLWNFSTSAEISAEKRLMFTDYLKEIEYGNDTKQLRKDLLSMGYGKEWKKDVPQRLHELKDMPMDSDVNDFEKYRIRSTTQVPDDTPIVWIKDQQILTVGNVSAISGVQKSGKSAIASAILCKMLNPQAETFPSIRVTGTDSKAILHIDTEQSKAKQKKNLMNWILRRAGKSEDPENFYSYHFRGFTGAQSIDHLSLIMNKLHAKHGGIHLVVIDGIADFVRSVNDLDQVTEVIKHVSELSDIYTCAILVNIHTNASSVFTGDHKPTGHLGSQIAKKCEACLTIFHDERKKDLSIMVPYVLREGSIDDFGEVFYQFDKQKGWHEELKDDAAEEFATKNKHIRMLRKITEMVKGLPFEGDAILDVMNEFEYSPEQAKKRIRECMDIGFLVMENGILKKSGKLKTKDPDEPDW